ncbi:MAG: hypothetical protein KatS3mg109_2289 [Pirellulaceae bacterium]|nr:MAG: hypothetical protein KatS3mg109_2289 [Pirellulaceae bacterium]
MNYLAHIVLLVFFTENLVREYYAVKDLQRNGAIFLDGADQIGSYDILERRMVPMRFDEVGYRLMNMVDPSFPRRPVRVIRFQYPPQTTGHADIIRNLRHLRALRLVLFLDVAQASEDNLRTLRAVRQLRGISVVGATDSCLKILGQMRQLEFLEIIPVDVEVNSEQRSCETDRRLADHEDGGGNWLTDCGIMQLSKLHHLRMLVVHFDDRPRITGKAIASLRSLPQLQVLIIVISGAFDPEVYDAIAELQNELPYLKVEIE